MSPRERFGLSAAMTTPFDAEDRIDLPRLIDHARWCLANGCDSVTLFGTTGEGASLSGEERAATFEALIAGGVAPDRLVYGVAETAIGNAVVRARAALEAGVRAVLVLPPFYFKNPSDTGLFDWYAAVFRGLGSVGRDVLLYHIPSITAVPLSLPLVRRLADAFPTVVRGVKDSGGDWAATEKLVAARGDLEILVGDERDLARAVRNGGAGAISGMGNVCPGRVRRLAVDGLDDPALSELVEAVIRTPVTPAVKALVAHVSGDAAWMRTRAPLEPTPAATAKALAELHDRLFPEARPARP
ncbi:MAG: dihydrodipicolinate synthase family protein [Hyphomicrobiales bacterium]|nr:dihydrodipicolinate synthase family protein [Hyphomicrobiales bacterium]